MQRPWGERWVRWWGRRSAPLAAAFNLILGVVFYFAEPGGPLAIKNIFVVFLMFALLVFERWQFHRIVDRQDRELVELRGTLAGLKQRT